MSDLPGYINLEVGEDVTDEDLQPLLQGLLAMHEYLGRSGVGEPKRVYTLNVHRNRNNLIGFLEDTLRNAERQIEDRAGEIRWMVEELSYNGYIYSNDAPLGARLVVFLGASRYSGYERDALMSSGAEMLRRTVVPVWHGNHPAWMRYGGAELHDTLSLSAAGLISDESARRERGRYVNDANAIQNFLGNLETQRGFESRNGAGAYAFLASELLASRAGPDALLRFFENLQLGQSWKTIFQKVFGMSVDEFYVLFDTHHRAGFPLVSVPVPSLPPEVEPRYSITTVTEEYSWEIDLPRGWIDDGESIRSEPGGKLEVLEVELRAGTTLEDFADSVIDNLRQDWWLTASRFEVNKVDKRRDAGNEFYIVEYVVQESPEYCALDVWELIAVGSSLPGSVKGFRAQHRLCEYEAREWESRRLDRTRRTTLESFRVITRPATYYTQFIDIEGIIVKANEMVEVASMHNSADVIRVMMSSLRDDIKGCLVRQGAGMAIAPFDAALTTLPEFYPQKGRLDWEAGLGAVKGQPVSGSDETGVMTGRYSVVLHEFAHAIDGLCFTRNDLNELVSIYENARRAELLSGTYAVSNYGEFFAEFSVRYFEPWDESAWNGAYGRLPSRKQLSEDFPEVFAFLKEIYPGFESEPYEPSITPSTPTPQPTATPIALEVTTPDQEALVALYKSTDGANWNNNTNWLTDLPLNRWHGVSTVGGRVTGLHLGDNGLRGEIPIVLGRLSALKELVLGDNELTGTIPPVLGQLNHLRRIRLSNNELVGEIPSEFDQLSNLRDLELDGNSLDSVPPEIGRLSNLKSLDISDNDFHSLPPEIGQLGNLRVLLLYENRFTSIPVEIDQLSNLRILDLRSNANLLGTLPESLSEIRDLNRLAYSGTGLCAPVVEDFQIWILKIPDREGHDCPPASTVGSDGGDDVIVRDIFGRVVNETGIVLVDWEGHIANPLMRYSLEIPGRSATLSSSEPRLYFDLPSSVGAYGPSKTIGPLSPGMTTDFRISIFPDRDTTDETHPLIIRYIDAMGRVRTQTMHVHVIDQDLDRDLEFNIIADFSYDETGMFDDPVARVTVQQAADDWAYFFADMNLDTVAAGTESMWINDPGPWGNGRYEMNTMAYIGFLLQVYGHPNDGMSNGSGASSDSDNQSSGGRKLPIKRSGIIHMDPAGNRNANGWLTTPLDSEWWKAHDQSKPADLYSGIIHEGGHAFVFHPSHDGFASFMEIGEIRDPVVREYFGSYPEVDDNAHLRGIDPASGRGAFGDGGKGYTFNGRTLPKKTDLLVAKAAGYVLRDTSPFRELSLPDDGLAEGNVGDEYAHAMNVVGGIPAYFWTIESGELPEGLSLNSFTGTISGTPTEAGTFEFTVRVRDQTEGHVGVTRALMLIVGD